MPNAFDEHEYARKLVKGGLSSSEARDIAAKTAVARQVPGAPKNKGVKTRGLGIKRDGDLFEAPARVSLTTTVPSSEGDERRPTVIETMAEHVSQLADNKARKSSKATAADTVELAQEAALLKETKEQLKTLQLSLFDIAPWPDHMRAMPNDFARSALFTVRNKRTPRADLKNEVIFHVMKDVRITYTGPELRAYDDELVWLQVMEYAKRVPVGQPVTFTLYQICKDLGWPINGQYYVRVEDCLTRLQTTALKFSSKRVGRLESLSLIRRFGFLDQTDKRKSRCQVLLEDEIVLLFAGKHYAKFVWEKYRKLNAITRRMFDYFSTHKEPFPLALESFRLMCKSSTTLPKKWREQASESCDELRKSGLVQNVWIKDNQIHCER